jgi:signal transduction histidine kinase
MMRPPDSTATLAPVGPDAVETLRAPDLLSTVCHDLRAPLASILMGTGFLHRALSPDDQAARRVVEAIQRSAEGMNQAIATFSDLARLGTHELSLEIAPHDVGALVKAAFDELVAGPLAQGMAISLELQPEIAPLPCDRERVVQILRQLAGAALRGLPQGGDIVLRAAADVGVRVEIVAKRNTAVGSRPITMEPPRPALALAKGLIELHGGSLEVTANADALALSFALPRPA